MIKVLANASDQRSWWPASVTCRMAAAERSVICRIKGAAAPDRLSLVIYALVLRGYSREAAEDLCANNPPPSEGDIETWIASVSDRDRRGRRALLDEHHKHGIPPAEPPPLRTDS